MTHRPLFGAILGALLSLGAGPLLAEEGSPASTGAEVRPLAELSRELIAWRKVLDTTEEERAPERTAAKAGIQAIGDERAVPIILELWQKDNDAKSTKHHGLYLAALKNITGLKAFNAIVKLSVESRSEEIRRDAASWIAAQDNRDQAIPQFTKYLKGPKFAKHALVSLGHTEIAKKSHPPDRDLVAALIDNLIYVRPIQKGVPYAYDTGWQQYSQTGYLRGWGTRWVQVTDFEMMEVSDAKTLLYAYCHQDFGFDQNAWRQNVLKKLQKSAVIEQSRQRQAATNQGDAQ